MENNQIMFGSGRSKRILIFLFLSLFIVAGLIFIGKLLYLPVYGFLFKETKMNIKSDAEIINYFQTREEKFNQLIQEEFQARKDYEVLRLEVNKKNEILRDQLKKNEEVNKNNEQLKYNEMFRLQQEISKNMDVLFQFNAKKRNETNKFLEGIGFSLFTSDPNLTKWSCGKSHYYEEEHPPDYKFRTTYSIQKGIVWFDENNQPDKQYVFDNIDKFHTNGNIVLDARSFTKKIGKDDETVYLPLEGNWYVFLTVRISKKYPDPIDGYNY